MNTEPTKINRDSDLRAGDTDREEFADFLRRNHVDGRLDSEEFAARIDRCYDAKTIGELQQLVSDLPSAPVRHAGAPAGRTGLFGAWWLLPLLFAAAAVAAHGGFWMLFPLLFFARFWFWGPAARRRGRSRWSDERVL